ncbi:hypothetical protein [Yoonia sp.]
MKRAFLLFRLLPFMQAANTNAAPMDAPDHVTRDEILSLFAHDLQRMPRH